MFYGSNRKPKEVSGITLLRLPLIISQANPRHHLYNHMLRVLSQLSNQPFPGAN